MACSLVAVRLDRCSTRCALVDSDIETQMRRLLCLVVAMGTLLAGCDSAESARTEGIRAQLVGTWLTEAESGQVTLRRVLSVEKDGRFSDRLLVTTSGEGAERREYAGEWSYDGTNFKRRFLQENGRQYAGGKIRYATFPLISVSASEFVVEDNIQGSKVTFRRVPEGTNP